MNKNQWDASAALFFLLGVYLFWFSSFLPITINSSGTTLIINRLYSILTLLSLFGVLFCAVNSHFEKTPAQKWAEVESFKRDLEFYMKLSKMSVKEREEYLKGYHKALMYISTAKIPLGETVVETEKRVLENLKKDKKK